VNRLIFRLAPLALVLVLPFATGLAGADDAAFAGVHRDPLTVVTARGTIHFKVEVARTAAEQERGLMFRDSIAPDAGMIFPFDPPQPASFWMKNTRIPLDIVFIRADGTIARIAAMAKPYSLDLIPSDEPVAAVLELAGGRAAAIGITPGDRVRWASLRTSRH
jgi:uncharacterized membrane protein (UPF0127 family)